MSTAKPILKKLSHGRYVLGFLLSEPSPAPPPPHSFPTTFQNAQPSLSFISRLDCPAHIEIAIWYPANIAFVHTCT